MASTIRGPNDTDTNAFYITYNNNEVKHIKEEVSYDFSNFVGEAGGSLGLFLGISLPSFFNFITYLAGKAISFAKSVIK